MCAKLDLVHEFLSGKNKYLNKPAIIMQACTEGPFGETTEYGNINCKKSRFQETGCT